MKLEYYAEELSGGLFTVITIYTVYEAVIFAAISGFVGAAFAYFAKKLFKYIEDKLKSNKINE